MTTATSANIKNENIITSTNTSSTTTTTVNNNEPSTTNLNSQSTSTTSSPTVEVFQTIDNPHNITITDKCARELLSVQSKMVDKKIRLRVMVDTGGCSGYQYIIKVDENLQEDDVIFVNKGAEVIIDKISLEMMNGAIIEYETDLMRSSFCVSHNPNTIKSCGCKISFDLKKK
eukprot:gene4002-5005_t